MYSKIFKNYQVNMGQPFQMKVPMDVRNIRTVNIYNENITDENNEGEPLEKESSEDIIALAHEEAELIVKEAELESKMIIDEARDKAEKKRLSVEEEARRKGYEDGINEAKKHYEDLISEAELIREHAKAEYKEVLSSIEKDVVDLVFDIARKVIGEEFTANKENILYLVKQAFEKCSSKEDIVLKVSSDDYEYLAENKDNLTSMVEGLGDFEIKKDMALKSGACMVETIYGCINAGIDTKINKVEEAFRNVVGVNI